MAETREGLGETAAFFRGGRVERGLGASPDTPILRPLSK